MINDIEVISLDRRQGNIATISLEGAKTLNRDLGDNDLSVVKYVNANTVLDDTPENRLLKTFFTFIKNMSLIVNLDSYQLKNISSNVSEIIIQAGVDKFEVFLNAVGVKSKLAVIKVNDEKRVAFDYGKKKIDFLDNASAGTISLTAQYISLYLLKLQLELNDYKNEIINIRQNQLDESDLGRYDDVATNLELIGKASFPFIFIDEFDAFYHYAVSKYMVKKLKAINCQFVLTTHNTGIMTNRLFRPDSTFIMNDKKILPVFETTDQELRKAHNLEKLYKGGAFS
jgi:hypothetical protein